MKIGVLSDTHIIQVTGTLERIYKGYLEDMDMILHAGDFVSEEVVEYLNRGNFHGVQGNMDPVGVRGILPVKKTVRIGSYRLGLIHGWGGAEGIEDRIISEFADVDIIVYGHSHKSSSHFKNGIYFFNPGTAIGYHKFGTHTIGILEIDDDIQGEIIEV
ncbi:MAG: YfcE family phosphodiesterase [Deltaproteobacteria bacterium]|nr:YfcE family phosphodiesterase [Deltaproteobacteria bacterium]